MDDNGIIVRQFFLETGTPGNIQRSEHAAQRGQGLVIRRLLHPAVATNHFTGAPGPCQDPEVFRVRVCAGAKTRTVIPNDQRLFKHVLGRQFARPSLVSCRQSRPPFGSVFVLQQRLEVGNGVTVISALKRPPRQGGTCYGGRRVFMFLVPAAFLSL